MKSNSARYNKLSDTAKAIGNELLAALFADVKARFGDAIKSFWLYDGDLCPGCLMRSTGRLKFHGQEVLAINAFVYRPRGVLIGYYLCEICTDFIFQEAAQHPYQQTPLHGEIERNLAAGYRRYLASLDA